MGFCNAKSILNALLSQSGVDSGWSPRKGGDNNNNWSPKSATFDSTPVLLSDVYDLLRLRDLLSTSPQSVPKIPRVTFINGREAYVMPMSFSREFPGLGRAGEGSLLGDRGRSANDRQSRYVHLMAAASCCTRRVGLAVTARGRARTRRRGFVPWRCRAPHCCAVRLALPLKLCWSLTVHKAQGATLSHVQVDISGVFAPGMIYTALSRVTHTDGLQVMGNVPEDHALVDPDVVRFYEAMERGEQVRQYRTVRFHEAMERGEQTCAWKGHLNPI